MRHCIACLLLLAGAVRCLNGQEAQQEILDVMRRFEGRFDPKCYATASRLEGLMYGSALSEEARFHRNGLMKQFVGAAWPREALSGGGAPLTSGEIISRVDKFFTVSPSGGGNVELAFEGGAKVTVAARDLRQYSSVAYSYRTILAMQQENLLNGRRVPSLGSGALEELKGRTDLLGLAVLKEADRRAREGGDRELSAAIIQQSWQHLFGDVGFVKPDSDPDPEMGEATGLSLLEGIIEQKRAAYAAYNEISNQLFVRNLQVYFARLSWPQDAGAARAVRQAFTETVIAFAADLYRVAAKQASSSHKPVVGELEAREAGQRFLPHLVNEYEDVIYFPRLGRGDRLVIESYDIDAFRDSGIHWHYLGLALSDLSGQRLPDADPFAAEMLAEYVAQFGVLLLRVAGAEGAARGEERLSRELLEKGMGKIQQQLLANSKRRAPGDEKLPNEISSATGNPTSESSPNFVELGEGSGISFMHRSSDWLNRQLRSYLEKDDATGIITIPPAFGGAGVAAEDIDGDGNTDLLLLGGLGNRLYLGRGDGRFTDFTERSGLTYRRGIDRLPGEPRQPLIADFDNDGYQDVVITYVDDDHQVFRGHGDGEFTNVTNVAGLGGKGLVAGPATTFDFDNDGLLDIYIAYFGDYLRGVLPTLKRRNSNGLPNRLFKNLGGMRFVDVTGAAGVGDTGWGQGTTHSDIDNDGWQDLIAGNDFGVNRYFRNRGDGSFEDISAILQTDKPSYTMSIATTDLNGDLAPDFYISNIVTMNKDEKYVLPNEETQMKFNLEKLAHLRVVGANDLFISQRTADGVGTYALSRSVGRGYASTGWAWDADFFDADLDGDDDLYVLNGMNEFNLYSSRNPYFMDPGDPAAKDAFVPVASMEPNVFFENTGGRLHTPDRPSGLEFSGNSRSASYLDWDGDGDLDVATNNYHEKARLFENRSRSDGSNWIKLDLVGDPERGINLDAIGAQAIIHLADDRTVWREIHGSTGYMSVHPKRIHAGVGSAKSVDVDIIWPNGTRRSYVGLVANHIHQIRFADPEMKAR